jgi:hypothetical protein
MTAAQCGEKGASCGRCGTGTICQAGTCQAGATGGGEGGAQGGGTGSSGTGGGAGGCQQVASFASANPLVADYWAFAKSPGHYNVVRFVQPAATPFDGLGIEVVYPNDVGLTAPFEYHLTGDSYFKCSLCSVYYQSCNAQLVCDKTYLARSGTVNVTRADRAPAGRMVGSASNLHYVEWDLETDSAVPNGACLEVGALQPFDVGWNQDGGAPPP